MTTKKDKIKSPLFTDVIAYLLLYYRKNWIGNCISQVAITNIKDWWCKQQEFIVSWFWRLEVQIQGVRRVWILLRPLFLARSWLPSLCVSCMTFSLCEHPPPPSVSSSSYEDRSSLL